VVILTFATILPVIEIPFVLIQVSKGCCVYYAHNLNFFFNALKLSKTSTNGLLQIHQVQKCDIISLGKFGTNKKKKKLVHFANMVGHVHQFEFYNCEV
jgi:hypothetical protein